MEHPGYNDIVPDDVQDELMQWGDEIDSRQWDVGQRANELVAEWDGKLSRYQVCEAVAFFNKQPGGTVRDWEYCYRNVPLQIRNEYEQLGISHFRLCIPYAKDLETWRDLLTRWMDEAKTLSVRSLDAWLAKENDKPPVYFARLRRTRESVKRIHETKEASRAIKLASLQYLKALNGELRLVSPPTTKSGEQRPGK